MSTHRIIAGKRAFEVQKRAGLDKDGNEAWQTIGYFRSRAAVVSFLRRERLPESLADDLLFYHGDVAAAVHRYCLNEGSRLVAARERSDRAKERRLARAVAGQEAPSAGGELPTTGSEADAAVLAA